MITTDELLSQFPYIAWRAPLPVRLSKDGNNYYGCRICIAQHGIRGGDVPALPTTQEGFATHLMAAHQLEAMLSEPIDGPEEAALLAGFAPKRDQS